jgi:hypothetical protein
MNEMGPYHLRGVWFPAEIYLDSNLSWMEKILLVEIDQLDGGDGCMDDIRYFAEFLQTDDVEVTKMIEHLETLDLIRQANDDGGLRLFLKHPSTGAMPPLNRPNRKSPKKTRKIPVQTDIRIKIHRANKDVTLPYLKMSSAGFSNQLAVLEKKADPCAVIEQNTDKGWKGPFPLQKRKQFLKFSSHTEVCKACGEQFKSHADLLGHYPVCPKAICAPPEFKKFVEGLRPRPKSGVSTILRKRREGLGP